MGFNVTARPLAESEKFVLAAVLGGDTPESVTVPAWGRVYVTSLGNVLIFDGADGRRFTLISGPDAEALAGRINLPVYHSPDEGLLAFLEDLTGRAADFGKGVLLFAGIVMVLAVVRKN